MLPLFLIVALEAALLAGILLARQPKLLIPATAAMLSIEYFEVAMGAGTGGPMYASVIYNPGQVLMAVTVVVGVLRFRHDLGRLIPGSALILPLIALVAVMTLAVAWADAMVPPPSVLIFALYIPFVFVAPSFIEDRRDVERIIGALLVAAILLSLIAIAQRGLGVFHWRDILIDSDGVSYRSNATFSDPNIFARYLTITMAAAVALILVTGPRRLTLYLAVPLLPLGALAMLATASRSGWLLIVFALAAMVLLSPIATYTRTKLMIAGGILGVGMLGLLFAQGGGEAERVASIFNYRAIIGAREFLLAGGWEMFKDNPLVGVGVGNYQRSLLLVYDHVLPGWATATLSHTSVVTTMAELGIVGLAFLGFFGARVLITAGRVYAATSSTFNRMVVGWLIVSLVAVFLHSQSEGRLFEERYLWVLFALLIAFETSPHLAGRAAPAPEPVPAPPAAEPLPPVTETHPAPTMSPSSPG